MGAVRSWDDTSANLPDVTVHGVTAYTSGYARDVATDQGVFFVRTNLNVLSVATPSWAALAGLLNTPATDVKLDSGAIQLWVALEGYGLYQTMAPHRAGDPRLIDSAGLIARVAAPGTLFSIEGARVSSANAGGLPVPVLFAADTGSQLQIPFEMRGDSVALAIDGPGGARTLPPVPLVSAAPAIQLDPSDGAPLLLDADNGVLLDAMHPRIRTRASRSWPLVSARWSRLGPPVYRLRRIRRIQWPRLSERCSMALPCRSPAQFSPPTT